MLKYVINLLITALVFICCANVFKGVYVESFGQGVVAAFLLGVLNSTLGFVMRLVFNLMSAGFFWLLGLGFVIRIIVMALCLMLVDHFMNSINIKTFGMAVLISFLISVGSFILDSIFKDSGQVV